MRRYTFLGCRVPRKTLMVWRLLLLLNTAASAFARVSTGSDLRIADVTPVCIAKSPDLGKCIVNSAQQMLLRLQEGVPQWGVPFLDPLKVPKLAIEKGSGALGFNITLSDALHYGLSTIRFLSADPDPEHYLFKFKVWIPTYSIVGHYEMNGRLLLLPVTGSGASNITLSNLTADWTLIGSPVKRDGQNYMQLKQFRVKVYPEKVKVMFENLFNGNKYLGNTMNSFLNTHWMELFKELRPALEEAISQLHKSLTERIFIAVPYSEFFSDIQQKP